MFTPWNVYPVKSKGYFTGACPACLGSRNDHISVECLDLVNRGHVIPSGLSSEFRIPSSEFGNAPCTMLAIPLGVRPFFEQVSHKAPPAHKEGGAFLFCPGEPNSSIVIHCRKERPYFQRRRVRTAARIKGLRYTGWNLTSPLMSWESMHICL